MLKKEKPWGEPRALFDHAGRNGIKENNHV
jgi:hypothetical protein